MAFRCETMKVLEIKDRINGAARISSRSAFFQRKKELKNAVLYSKEFSQIDKRAYDMLLNHLEKKMPDDREFKRNVLRRDDSLEEAITRRNHAERS